MVGVIISAIVAGTAIVSVLGFTRMINNDNARTSLTTLSTGLETYYTEHDRYPLKMADLTANGKYVPAHFGALAKDSLCYVPAAGNYPQSYTITTKAVSTGAFFYINGDMKKAELTPTYPAVTTCK